LGGWRRPSVMKSIKTRARHKVCAIVARVHFIQPLKERIVREAAMDCRSRERQRLTW
jgi:hypothetical protein